MEIKTYVYRLQYSAEIDEDEWDWIVKKGSIKASSLGEATSILMKEYPQTEELFILDCFEQDNELEPMEFLEEMLEAHRFRN